MDIKRPPSGQPIPDDAKKVFDGVVFDVYQWEQELYDGSITTFEKIKRRSSAIAFPILPNGNIILTKQVQPGINEMIGGTGGRVDHGEDVFDAVKRETLEESGYESDNWVFWKSVQPVIKIEWEVYFFLAKNAQKVVEADPGSGEKVSLLEVTFDEFIDIGMQENFYEPELYRDFAEAKLDPVKMETLRELFKPE